MLIIEQFNTDGLIGGTIKNDVLYIFNTVFVSLIRSYLGL